MAIHLVTGHAGTEHITAGDTGRLIAGIVGVGRYVLRTGTQLEATVVNSNLIRIGSGDAVDQGRHICIAAGTYEEASIDNGTQGKRRIDTICLRYSKNGSGVESASLVVVKGTEVSVSATPSAPTTVSGDILSGESMDDLPIYNVRINETQIEGVNTVFALAPSLTSIIDLTYPVGSIYMSTRSESPEVLFPGTRWYTISGRFLFGSDDGYAVGTRGGEATHTLTESEMPSHTHGMSAHSHNVPAHKHTATVSAAPNHEHLVSLQKAGAAGSERMVVVDSGGTATAATQQAGSHRHTVTINNANALQTDGVITLPGPTGGSEAHNNMPPYYVVNMWRRYA